VRTTALAAAVLSGAALVLGVVATPASAPSAQAHSFAPIEKAALTHPMVGGKFNQNGYNWSGIVTTGSGFTSVSASWNEPTVTCNSSNDLYAPWVGIDGYGSSSVEQTGVATDCSSGRPVYQAWYEMYPANPVYYSNAVSGGDSFTGKVTRSGTSYTLTITDNTKGWTKTTTKSYSGANASAEFILESPTAAYPRFGKVTFTNALVNGKSIGSYSTVALDASSSAGYEDHTSAISGSSFSVTYVRE
jgi:Peptidase A4 family